MGVAARTAILVLATLACECARPASELRFCLHADPKTFDPLLAGEEASETVSYLTGGVLIRFNRQTQQLEPELASSWKVRDQGKRIDFVLRRGVLFSDGTPFGPADVVATFKRLVDPDLNSAVADTFRSASRRISAQQTGPNEVSVIFSAPVAGLEMLFGQLAITPARPVRAGSAVLGPFMFADYKSGQYVLLKRNPNYWKSAADGGRLPCLDSIRLDIQANRDIELLRFRRGELHLLDKLDPEAFERLRGDMPEAVLNAGPSLDSEFLWFNQNPNATFPLHKKRWFQSTLFRRALSFAINRSDIIRLVYLGHAHAAAGPVSSANKVWFNATLRPYRYDPQLALRVLREDGFHFDGNILRDRGGNPVEFTMITNSGSRTRTRIGTMLQQDLQKIGIQLDFTPLEFQSLIERITRTQQYEACLLGFTNLEVDPNSQMNVWISSGSHHAWNPGQTKPATSWEAEIDRLMKLQATAGDLKVRKGAFDRVQQLLSDEVPMIYLVHPDVLVAVASSVRNASPSVLPPHLLWNVQHLLLGPGVRGNK